MYFYGTFGFCQYTGPAEVFFAPTGAAAYHWYIIMYGGKGGSSNRETALEERRKETADRVARFRVDQQIEPIYATYCKLLRLLRI